MTAVAIPQTLPITLKALRALLVERGLKLQVATKTEVVARWPLPITTVAREGARATVLRRNERDEWRGVVMVNSEGKGWGLVAQRTRFRDLLDIEMWLRCYAPGAGTPQLHEVR